jgi:hypothetical protein
VRFVQLMLMLQPFQLGLEETFRGGNSGFIHFMHMISVMHMTYDD